MRDNAKQGPGATLANAQSNFKRIHELLLKLDEAAFRKDFSLISPQFEALRRSVVCHIIGDPALDVGGPHRSRAITSLKTGIANALDEIESTLCHDWSGADKLRFLAIPMRRLSAQLAEFEAAVLQEHRVVPGSRAVAPALSSNPAGASPGASQSSP